MASRRFPLLGKAFALAAVLIALVAALHSVSGIVAEREGRLREAERSVADSLASAQTLLGPVLQRDCVETWEETVGEGKDKKTVTTRDDYKLAAAPAALDVKGSAAIEPRRRGIFTVNGYVLTATLVATWDDSSALAPTLRHAGARLACGAPSLFVAVGDARGLRSVKVELDGSPSAVLPGTGASAPRGFHVDVAEAKVGGRKPLRTEIALELVGTGELSFAPVGDTTRVELRSDWPHPSFGGRFLPVDREIGEKGFAARWQLTSLATTAPQTVVDGGRACRVDAAAGIAEQTDLRNGNCVETFGVAFIDPVSPYVLSDRATKYGLLFIALTFVAVGAVEVLKRVRVHPIQYLLVGSGIAIFFLLLVSLSEHLAFAAAYAIAATASTLLLAFYGSFVLRGLRAGVAFGAGIGALYAALYALLQLEQTALLLGSLLLFAVLASVMFATRRIDWYALFERMRSEPARPAVA